MGYEFRSVPKRELIGSVSKKWFTWGDSYQLQIADDEMEPLLVALVVAIDCAKADQAAAAAGAGRNKTIKVSFRQTL